MSYDVDLFVIGAGSGGVRAARFAAGFGARVAIAESRYLGGTCVNVGCVPKKLLVHGAQFSEHFAHASGYGWSMPEPSFDWPTLITHKNGEIKRLNGVYQRLLEGAGVSLLNGHAKLLDAHTVQVNEQTIRAKHILIATGGWPHIPDIPGRELAIGSNEAFYLPQLPKRVLVVGGGYIAVEFASIFHGLGADVSQIYRGDLFLRGFDQAVREHIRDAFTEKKLKLLFNTDIVAIRREDDGSLMATLADGQEVATDCVFYATGRRPMLDDLGLENTRVELNAKGFVQVDAQYVTAEPSIMAIGDVIGDAFAGKAQRLSLTPVALAEGMAVARRLFKPDEYHPVDYQNIPTAVFSLPNISTVGLSEQQAITAGHSVLIFETRFRSLPLSITQDREKTLIKLVVDADTDRVLGCHMVGAEAGEVIQGIAVALKAGATKRVFDETMGIHPTVAEEFVTLRTPRD
ncbi:MAG: glutathione-disulfide reductase [Moraxellaceae bacterium]|nr:glutathione-disulfide reductase [Moraxellaceae bacterium]MDP1776827.1 glutathione-disulfide reductase [Moraxellaceae bacterium]